MLCDINNTEFEIVQLTKSRAGNDRYAERSMNTFNDALKNKTTQTTKITHRDASAYATIWDMYDTYNENQGLPAKYLLHDCYC